MGSGIFFPICAIPVALIILITFNIKEHINSKETNLYNRLVLANLIGLIVELMCAWACRIFDSNQILASIILKGYLLYLISWTALFAKYVHIISVDNAKKYFDLIYSILAIAVMVIISILPINVVLENNGTVFYTTGPSVDFSYAISGVYILFILFIVFRSIKQIRNKKYLPVFLLFAIGTVAIAIQKNYPQLLLLTYCQTIICLCMYFTIENPDVKMLEQIEMEKDRAEKANVAKSDFLSSMSHEIRTPLNAIVGFSECINQSETLEEAIDNAKDIVGASETLLEIVNGILDISKIESGKIELVENDYNPYKMLEETVKLARGRLADKPLDFQVNIAQDIPKALYGDKFNIKKILINFLTNAIKYTDEGFVRFDVQCVKLNDMVRLIFTVSDSGRGIKKEDINKLFTKFQRLDEEKNQTIEGTGLGLAITKQLIEMMNGKVVVDSVYGEGSKFTFILDQKISNAELEDTTARIDVVADLTGKRILVVDDNKLNLKVATKLLKTYGVDITLCNSGPECIGLIDDGNKFDLILLDDMMPGMSGIDTLHELKNMPTFNIPTIALTANAINGMKEKYLEAGFDDYLAKPIDRYELNSALVRFLNPVSSYEADSEISNPPKEEKMDNTPVELTKEEVVKNTSTTTNNPSIPKFVPDNAPIIVLPGDMQKSSEVQEKTSNETTTDNGNKDSKILLIVDDNNLNIKVESKLITSLGYEVESANSGIEAINKVKSGKYDLIFMDIMMPMMDGVQTLHELKKINGFNTPVVALTADAVLGAKEKYLAEGFDLYVTKPADKEELQEVLDKFNV